MLLKALLPQILKHMQVLISTPSAIALNLQVLIPMKASLL